MIQDDIELVLKADPTTSIQKHIALGRIYEVLNMGRSVLLFHNHVNLSSKFIFLDSNMLDVFSFMDEKATENPAMYRHIYWDFKIDVIEDEQPYGYDKIYPLTPVDIHYLDLVTIVPVNNFIEALEYIKEKVDEYKIFHELIED